MLRLHFSESAQILGLDMAVAGGRGVKCKMDHVRASLGLGGNWPTPQNPSRTPPFIGGPPTAVDEEPAPDGVLPQDVLSLADVLPSVLHLHLVEL